MKNFKRIVAMLLAMLLLCSTMSALADARQARGAARIVGNDDEQAPEILRYYTLNVGERKQIIRSVSSSTGRFDVSLVSSDPSVVQVKGKRVVLALAPGKCIVTATMVFDWRKDKPVEQNFEITVLGGPAISANGRTVDEDDVLRLKVLKPVRLEVKYLKLLRVKSWYSSDPGILRIVTRKSVCSVIPQRPGRCTITVRLYGGKKLSCKVLVVA